MHVTQFSLKWGLALYGTNPLKYFVQIPTVEWKWKKLQLEQAQYQCLHVDFHIQNTINLSALQ